MTHEIYHHKLTIIYNVSMYTQMHAIPRIRKLQLICYFESLKIHI